MFFFAVAGRSGPTSALRTAASRSIASATAVGRSTAFSADVQTGSSVPLTISRLRASSLFCSVASALTTAWRRVACSACACTMSIGAIVPISTRERLSFTSCVARSSEARCVLEVQLREDQLPVRVADLRRRARDGRLEIELGDVAAGSSCCSRLERVLSILKFCSSGCVNWARKPLLNAGLKVELMRSVFCRLFVQLEVVGAAEPAQVLRQAGVPVRGVVYGRRRRLRSSCWAAASASWRCRWTSAIGR